MPQKANTGRFVVNRIRRYSISSLQDLQQVVSMILSRQRPGVSIIVMGLNGCIKRFVENQGLPRSVIFNNSAGKPNFLAHKKCDRCLRGDIKHLSHLIKNKNKTDNSNCKEPVKHIYKKPHNDDDDISPPGICPIPTSNLIQAC